MKPKMTLEAAIKEVFKDVPVSIIKEGSQPSIWGKLMDIAFEGRDPILSPMTIEVPESGDTIPSKRGLV